MKLSKTLLAGVAAVGLTAGTALAQQIVLVPQGQGPEGMQQFILVPVPQDEMQQGSSQQQGGDQQQGADQQSAANAGKQQGIDRFGSKQQLGLSQQGTTQQGMSQQSSNGNGQQAANQQMRDRAEAQAMNLYRRGYQRGVAEARNASQIDPSAIQQIGRELFERGYVLGMMQAQYQLAQQSAMNQIQEKGANQQQSTNGQQQDGQQQAQAGQQQSGQQPAQTAQQQNAGSSQQQNAGSGQQQNQQQAQQQNQQQASANQQSGQSGQQQAQQHVQHKVGELLDATNMAENGPAQGNFLVDRDGRPVYIFTGDQRGKGDAQKSASNCYGDCAQHWPPVLKQGQELRGVGDVNSDLLGTVQRRDGTTQVTYNGWPLYYHGDDQSQDQASGQGVQDFGGKWSLVTPSGKKSAEQG